MASTASDGAIIAGYNKGGQLVVSGTFKTVVRMIPPIKGLTSLFYKPVNITSLIESCEVYDQTSETKGGGLAKTMAGGYLFGLTGALVASKSKTKNEWTIKVVLKDGHKMLVKCLKSETKDKLLGAGFGDSEDF